MDKLMTGIRPTGPLHLGHYIGALKQWVHLQDKYECYFMVADIQALTTHADNPALIEDSIREVVLDFLALGLDPEKENVNFILQSAIPELTELTTYFSMVTPFSWMQANPTIQTEMKNLKTVTTGFMYYPVSQAADILFVSPDPNKSDKPICVPVGEDQLPHLRDTSAVARAFNSAYGKTFVECKGVVGEVGRLVGTDGQAKMSKSLNNAIYFKDSEKEIEKKVMSMYTDPNRIHPTDPGKVEGNPVFIYHDTFNKNKAEVAELKEKYVKGAVGDVEVKRRLNAALQEFIAPIRKRREGFTESDVQKYLTDGTKKAQKLAQTSLQRARSAMHLDYLQK
jgi:tryptophanyl-tRNA synthetase